MEEKVLMTPEELLEGVRTLSKSSRYYLHLYSTWTTKFSPEELEMLLDEYIIEYSLTDIVDFVLTLEG